MFVVCVFLKWGFSTLVMLWCLCCCGSYRGFGMWFVVDDVSVGFHQVPNLLGMVLSVRWFIFMCLLVGVIGCDFLSYGG